MKIYVVTAGSGEYEEYREYLVKAFYDETTAGEYVIKCQKQANELKKEYDTFDTSYYNNPYLDDEAWESMCNAHEAYKQYVRGKIEYDQKLDLYDLTTYRYETIEIE